MLNKITPAPLSATDPDARLLSVDAVRGFALFGVLLVNMYNFGAYSPEWTDSLDRVFSALMHSVFETKSWRLFSLLFGFGFALQLARATLNYEDVEIISPDETHADAFDP